MAFFLGLAVVAALAYRCLSPEERVRVLGRAAEHVRRANEYGRSELESLQQALRVRTPRLLVTPAIAALNTIVFIGIMLSAANANDPSTLITWGASVGPRTTNGEWWRLVTATFVNGGFVQVVILTIAIVQIGSAVERLVGPSAFAAAYVLAGVFGALGALWFSPTTVTAGASTALCGVYGLLMACAVTTWWRRGDCTITPGSLKRFAPAGVASLLYVCADPGVTIGLAGLVTGVLVGLIAARDVASHATPIRRTRLAVVVGLIVALIGAVPVRGMVDVAEEMRQLAAMEHHTDQTYRAASGGVAKHKIAPEELAALIEQKIMPELKARTGRIEALHGVPHDEEWRIAGARHYLQLRSESWRLRATGLRDAAAPVDAAHAAKSRLTFRAWAEARHDAVTRTFGKAEASERESLETLKQIAGDSAVAGG